MIKQDKLKVFRFFSWLIMKIAVLTEKTNVHPFSSGKLIFWCPFLFISNYAPRSGSEKVHPVLLDGFITKARSRKSIYSQNLVCALLHWYGVYLTDDKETKRLLKDQHQKERLKMEMSE